MTKLRWFSTALVVAGMATMLVIQHQNQNSLRDENRSLRQQIEQLLTDNSSLSARLDRAQKVPKLRLPAPAVQMDPRAAAPTEELPGTNLYTRFGAGPQKLTAAQAAAYLAANGRKAATLLAAFRTSGDPELLREAMQKFPNDPQVAFEAVFKGELSPQQRRLWLDAFEQSAPDNALANYLSAQEYFKVGKTDEAIHKLIAASDKGQFQDYTLARAQDNEEAYLQAGYSAAAAKFIASQVELPQLSELKQLGLQMAELAHSYRDAGDEGSAQVLLDMTVNLGRSYGTASAGDSAISYLVGLAIEGNALSAMAPNSPYGEAGRTVQDRLAEVIQQRAALKALVRQSEPLLQTMPDQDWISYIDRIKSSGETSALQWVVNKHGQK